MTKEPKIITKKSPVKTIDVSDLSDYEVKVINLYIKTLRMAHKSPGKLVGEQTDSKLIKTTEEG